MADDKKKKRKAAGQPASDNVPAQPENDNIPEPPKKSPREIWNELPADDKRKIKEGEFVIEFGDHDKTDEELTNEELANYALEELEARKQLNEILETEAKTITEKVNNLQELGVTKESVAAWSERTTELIKEILGTWQDFFAGINGVIENNIAVVPEVMEAIQRLSDSILSNDVLRQTIEEYERLKPFVDAELRKPKYKGKKFLELTKAEGREVEAAARAAMEKQGTALPSFAATKPTGLQFPLTKIQKDLFSMLAIASADKKNVPGQLAFSNIPLAVESAKDKKERTIIYSIIFDSIDTAKISKALTNYDRRVYDAISSLFDAGNIVISFPQIYAAMGNDGSLNTRDRNKINAAVTKMATAWLTLDQTEDYDAYTDESKGKLGVRVKQQLLYIKIGEAYINGKYVESAVYLLEEPVLLTLAKDRKQVTSIPREVITTKQSQTEDTLAIENLLLDRIARMKNPKSKSSNRIRYQAIYDALEIPNNDRKKKSRTLTKVFELLDHYKDVGWIKSYKEETSTKGEQGVSIQF